MGRKWWDGQAKEDDVYVRWAKLRSSNRTGALLHLDDVVALDPLVGATVQLTDTPRDPAGNILSGRAVGAGIGAVPIPPQHSSDSPPSRARIPLKSPPRRNPPGVPTKLPSKKMPSELYRLEGIFCRASPAEGYASLGGTVEFWDRTPRQNDDALEIPECQLRFMGLPASDPRVIKLWASLRQKLAQRRESERPPSKPEALGEIRKNRHLSQIDLAYRLGTRQADLSRLERRSDMLVSTLRRYIEALGGSLELSARFPGLLVRIDFPAGTVQTGASAPEPGSYSDSEVRRAP